MAVPVSGSGAGRRRGDDWRPRAGRLIWSGIALGGLLSGVTGSAAAGDAPATVTAPAPGRPPTELLARMASALDGTGFEGTLVYLHGQHLAALRIVHRIDDGESRESLFALSGPIRAMARNGHGVTCVLPDAHPIQVQRGAGLGSVLRSELPDLTRLAPHYQIATLGESRIAGRDTDVVGIIPRDDLRYGYRYYIDRATGLPLKTDLMDASATPVEQVMFTDIEVLSQATPMAAGTTTVVAASASAPAPAALAGWRFANLPTGFAVLAQGEERGDEEHPARETVLLGDGFASVSVTTEPASGAPFVGVTCMGAAHAAGKVSNGQQIIAVGEVPAATVEAILAAVQVAGRGARR